MMINNWLASINISSILDIIFLSILIYAFLIWFKKTRAASVLTGMIIVAAIYLIARQFNMVMASSIFEKFFTVIFLALIIIFQEELRHIFEKIANWRLNKNLMTKRSSTVNLPEIETLVLTLADLAKDKIGALIVLKGKDALSRHLDGGIALNADLSEPLLKSLFDAHSVGHDGATILEDNKLSKFMVHLPLSKNLKKLGHKGTRHAAALGLSELSDALCLVVSEERGQVSYARHGVLETVTEPVQLTKIIDDFYQQVHPKQSISLWQYIFKKDMLAKLIAVISSLIIWFVLVYGSKNSYYTIPIDITHIGLPPTWQLAKSEPNKINATFRGPRRSFYFISKNKFSLQLTPKLNLGPQVFHLTPKHFSFPKELFLEDIDPAQITLELQKLPVDDNKK